MPLTISQVGSGTKRRTAGFWALGHEKEEAMNEVFQRRLRASIVGGPGSFIGAVHRVAAELDGQAQVIAGAMSSNPHKAHEAAAAWFLPRSYESYTPMTLTLEEAYELVRLVESQHAVFALTHTYTGYPLVRQARELVRLGAIGEVRKVFVDYVQDWLIEPIEQGGSKQAAWRTDPARSGIAGAVGDIGTHAENLLEYITGLRIRSLCADLTTFVEGRALDD